MKSIFILVLLLIHSASAQTQKQSPCSQCKKAEDLIVKFKANVASFPKNSCVFSDEKGKFITDSTAIAVELTKPTTPFTEEKAQALALITKYVAYYDREQHLQQELELSKAQKNLLKTIFDKNFGPELSLKLQEYLGLIPSADRLNNLPCPDKN